MEEVHLVDKVDKSKSLSDGSATIYDEIPGCPSLKVSIKFSQGFCPVLFHCVAYIDMPKTMIASVFQMMGTGACCLPAC